MQTDMREETIPPMQFYAAWISHAILYNNWVFKIHWETLHRTQLTIKDKKPKQID